MRTETVTEFEVFDNEVVEGVRHTYRGCVFFECQLVGRQNTYTDCRFQGGVLMEAPGSLFDGCLFYGGDCTDTGITL